MTDFDEVKRQVSELLQYMVDRIDEYKLPLVRQASLEVELSCIGGIAKFPGVEIKSRGLRKSSPKKKFELERELHRRVEPLSGSPKDIGLPAIFGAKITVRRGETVSGELIWAGELTEEQQEIEDELLEDWDRTVSSPHFPTEHIDQIDGGKAIIDRSNELLDFLLDIARRRKLRFKKTAQIGAKRFQTSKGEPIVMLYGLDIRCGKDSQSEALRTEVQSRMDAVSKALIDAGLPGLSYAVVQFWPRTSQISPEIGFLPGTSSEQEAVLIDLESYWFKHLNNLHETDGQYCPGCGKTKCRN